MTTLAFVERPSQVRTGLAAARKSGRDVTWIALRPAAAWALEQAGQPFRDLDEFHDLPALARLDTRNIERTERFCLWADERIRECLPAARDAGLEAAVACYFNFRHVFNAPSLCHALYERVREAFPAPRETWFWRDHPEPPGPELWLKRESAWSRYLAYRLTGGVRAFSAEPEPAARPARPGTGSGILKALGCLADAAAALRRPAAERLAVMDESYDLRRALELNRRSNRFAAFNLNRLLRLLEPVARLLPEPCSRAQAEALWRGLSGDDSLRRWADFDGFDAYPLIEDRIRHFFLKIVPHALALQGLSARVFRTLRPGVLAASAMGRYREKVVFSAARSASIPSAVYQHGDMGLRAMGPLSHKFWYYNDVYFSDLYLVFGEGQVSFCNEKYVESGAAVPVGSAALDELGRRRTPLLRGALRRSLGLPEQRPLFVFPLGQLSSGIKVPPTYRSEGATFMTQRRIIETFARHPQVDLVVAPKGSDAAAGSPLLDLLASRNWPNVFLSTAGFSRLAAAADAFVLDWPTTTFLESLATDRPVLMTDHLLNWDWQPDVSAHFGGRVLYARELDAFIELLERFLARGDYALSKDRALIARYGTFQDDGRSAERALDALSTLAAGRLARGGRREALQS